MSENSKILGVLAQFDGSASLIHAAKKIRDAGFKDFDCHSPFPIHGMDDAMGLKRSPLGWMVGIIAICGAVLAMYFQWWTSGVSYPIVISGKPFFSWPAFFPITFGAAVLFGALTSVFGMFGLNRLPRLHHPVFYSENFAKFSEDGFFVSVESSDPKFDEKNTADFLKEIGGTNIEVIRGE